MRETVTQRQSLYDFIYEVKLSQNHRCREKNDGFWGRKKGGREGGRREEGRRGKREEGKKGGGGKKAGGEGERELLFDQYRPPIL
jgi:hypothetical protein